LDINANLVNTVRLPNSQNEICADFDQKRKEIILLSKNCELKSYAVRLVLTTLKNGTSQSQYHAIYRMQTRMPSDLINPPVQLICQDVPGSTLILTSNGTISCWETSGLEILWHIGSSRFLQPPVRIYADRFGPAFCLLCSSNSSNALEMWIPPPTLTQAMASTFERFIIPIQASILQLKIETIGDDFGTSIMIIQSNRHAQLWVWNSVQHSLCRHSDLLLTAQSQTFSSFCFPPLSSELSTDPATPIMEPINHFNEALNRSLPLTVGDFSVARGLPGCRVIYAAFSSSCSCLLSLHSPSLPDKEWLQLSHRIMKGGGNHTGESRGGPPIDAPASPLLSFQLNTSPSKPPSSPTPASQPRLSHSLSVPGVDIMTDSMATEEMTLPLARAAAPVMDPNGDVFFYTPSFSLIHSNDAVAKKGILQVVSPSSLVIQSDPFADDALTTNPIIRQMSRMGIFPPGNTPPGSSIRFQHTGIAPKSGQMVVITEIKEGLIYNLRPRSADFPTRPIRIEVEIRPQATVSCLLVCDVFIRLTPDQLASGNHAESTECGGIIGNHVLSLIGDTDGVINFALSGTSSVLHQGSIRAHTSPVVAIMSTGDATKGLWRIATMNKSRGLKELFPKPCPGSAIVSLSKEGEIKVWQPLFSQSGSARATHSQLLSIYQLSWRVSGIGMATPLQLSPDSPLATPTSAALDPSCITCFIGYSDGNMMQWPLPGLTDRGGQGKVQVLKKSLWYEQRHYDQITHLQMWIHLPDTSIRSAGIDFSQKGTIGIDPSKISKYSAVVGDHTISDTSEPSSIAYTLDDLKKIAENSSFVTSSRDHTVSLWRFVISRNMEVPDFVDAHSKRLYPKTRYLFAVRSQMFTVSSSPTLGLCYPIPYVGGSSQAIWRVTAIVSGLVITLAQGTRGHLFAHKDSQDGVNSFPILSAAPTLSSMVIICNVHKPLKSSDAGSAYGFIPGGYSWDILTDWQNENILLPELESSVPVSEDYAPLLKPEDAIAPAPAPLLFTSPRATAVEEDLRRDLHMTDDPDVLLPVQSAKAVQVGLEEIEQSAKIQHLTKEPKQVRPTRVKVKSQLKETAPRLTEQLPDADGMIRVMHNGIFLKVKATEADKKSLESIAPKVYNLSFLACLI
jgi:hypothetical protein